MSRDLRIFLLAIGLPALLLALGGLRLIQMESARIVESKRSRLTSVAKYAAAEIPRRIELEVVDSIKRAVAGEESGEESPPARLTELELHRRLRSLELAAPAADYVCRIRKGSVTSRGPLMPPPESGPKGEPPPPDMVRRQEQKQRVRRVHGANRGWVNSSTVRNYQPLVSRLQVKLPSAPHVPLLIDVGTNVISRIQEILQETEFSGTLSRYSYSIGKKSVRSDEPPPRPWEPASDGDACEFRLAPPFGQLMLQLDLRQVEAVIAADLRTYRLFGGLILISLICSLVGGAVMLLRVASTARREVMQKTDFLSNVSHEFKTPLTTMSLCTELAIGDDLDDDERKRAIATVASETDRLRRLVMNVLDFSRLERGRRVYHPAEFDVAELTRKIAAEVSTRFTNGGLHVAEGMAPVNADSDAAHQIILNLLDNAAKYAAAGGPVNVTFAQVGELTEVRVADHGPGLTSDEMSHVFDRFWRADTSITCETGGNGLGLSISKGLALGMKGDLTVKAIVGGGCEFVLSLPTRASENGGKA